MGATEDSVRRSARVLTGFMSEQEARNFTSNVVLDADPFMLAWATHSAARTKLSPSVPSPRIEDIPAEAQTYVQTLKAHPLFLPNYRDAEIKMFELGKLVAMQHWVDCDASDGIHAVKVSSAPTIQELLTTCLPSDLSPPAKTHWQQVPNGFVVSTLDNSFGLRGFQANPQTNIANMVFGPGANLMLVREHGGRHVLANGYHRAWMLRRRGVEMIPAVLVPVSKAEEVVPPGFISPEHVFGPRPPLVDDFADDSIAVTTTVRAMVTMVKVTIETLRAPRFI